MKLAAQVSTMHMFTIYIYIYEVILVTNHVISLWKNMVICVAGLDLLHFKLMGL